MGEKDTRKKIIYGEKDTKNEKKKKKERKKRERRIQTSVGGDEAI